MPPFARPLFALILACILIAPAFADCPGGRCFPQPAASYRPQYRAPQYQAPRYYAPQPVRRYVRNYRPRFFRRGVIGTRCECRCDCPGCRCR